MNAVPEGWSVASRQIFDDVLEERFQQLRKWGQQRLPDGTATAISPWDADYYRTLCQTAFRDGEGTWRHVLLEEIYEALAESEREPLRSELIQCAAVIFSWVEDIDNRSGDRAVLASAA